MTQWLQGADVKIMECAICGHVGRCATSRSAISKKGQQHWYQDRKV